MPILPVDREKRAWFVDALTKAFEPKDESPMEFGFDPKLSKPAFDFLVPTPEDAITNLVTPGYLSTGDVTKKLLKGSLSDFVDAYKVLQGVPVENPATRMFNRHGRAMLAAIRGGLATKYDTSIERAVQKGISPYVEDLTSTLTRKEGSGGTAYALPQWLGRRLEDIWPGAYPSPDKNLLIPSFIIRRKTDPIDFLDTLFHEGTHTQYRLDPTTLEKTLNMTKPYYKDIPEYAGKVLDFAEGIKKGHLSEFPYFPGPTQNFEESLVSGIARSTLGKRGYMTEYVLPQKLQNPIYHDYDLLDELATLYYGAP